MDEVAPGVWQLPARHYFNTFLMGDVLVDSATPLDAKRILGHLQGRTVTGHALTHSHPDHMGSSHAVCTQLGIPFMVGERDVPEAEDPGLAVNDFVSFMPRNRLSDAVFRGLSGPGHPVDRVLREGDEVAGFTVLDLPGHTRGHVGFWRESDRTLVAGDVIWNFPRLMIPPKPVNSDTRQLRESVRRIAELEPAVVIPGHGPPLRDPAALAALVA